MYIKFCHFGPYADVKASEESKKEPSTDAYWKVRLYKRISAVFITLSVLLLAVLLALSVKLYEVESIQKCPESTDVEELNCSRQLCQTMYPSTQDDQNQVSVKCPESVELKCTCELCQTMCPSTKVASNPVYQCSECGPGWVKFENSCYFVSKKRLTWQESRKACQKQGGDLVVINNERVQKFLTESRSLLYWIGLHYSEKKQWMWINNTAPIQSYWSNGQPDPDSQGSCVLLGGGTSYINNWHSNPCEVYSHYICQRG